VEEYLAELITCGSTWAIKLRISDLKLRPFFNPFCETEKYHPEAIFVYLCSTNKKNAMKKLLFLLLIVPFWYACGSDEPVKDPVKDSLTAVTTELSGINADQAAALDSFFRAMNDIQANLDEIKKKEKIISKDTASGDVASRKDQITNDIQSIYDLMVKNKQRLASAKKNLKDANLKIASMQTTIDQLTIQLADRETEIAELRDQLQSLNLELSNLSMNYQETQEESDAKTKKLNTAYYAYGTSKALTKMGVLTKEGGFIGIGKTEQLSKDMNTSYFTQVDISEVKEIPLGADYKKPYLVTTHPADSFKFEGSNGKMNKLIITDSEKFWSVSKYLVIVVE
jgi:predicted  nucleic acid-binding Zn-ribbon protein